MKFCSKCGAPCGDDVNICPECGSTFPENTNGNSNILYLLVAIFGFAIVAYCLMQDTINKTARLRYGR